jgi:hypothetical protein
MASTLSFTCAGLQKRLREVRLMPLRADLSTREGGKEIVSCCGRCFPNPGERWMGCYSSVAVARGVCMMQERWESPRSGTSAVSIKLLCWSYSSDVSESDGGLVYETSEQLSWTGVIKMAERD